MTCDRTDIFTLYQSPNDPNKQTNYIIRFTHGDNFMILNRLMCDLAKIIPGGGIQIPH